jgi:hypothetical protein
MVGCARISARPRPASTAKPHQVATRVRGAARSSAGAAVSRPRPTVAPLTASNRDTAVMSAERESPSTDRGCSVGLAPRFRGPRRQHDGASLGGRVGRPRPPAAEHPRTVAERRCIRPTNVVVHRHHRTIGASHARCIHARCIHARCIRSRATSPAPVHQDGSSPQLRPVRAQQCIRSGAGVRVRTHTRDETAALHGASCLPHAPGVHLSGGWVGSAAGAVALRAQRRTSIPDLGALTPRRRAAA